MMEADVRTELLKLRSAGRTLAGCIQLVVMDRGQQKQGMYCSKTERLARVDWWTRLTG